MNAARLPALACVFFISAAALSHDAIAAEEGTLRAKPVLRAAVNAASPAVASATPLRIEASIDAQAADAWAEPPRLLIVFAALIVFLAYRRRARD